eukprot:Skav228554  [mRNA]  locus=scaffold1887:633101:641552:- [translate_table: standard]
MSPVGKPREFGQRDRATTADLRTTLAFLALQQAEERCNAFSFREGFACELRHCFATELEVWRMEGWQSWRRGAPRCLQRAWVKEEELIAFPASAVEKNWNLIEGQRDRLFLEYFIEPHIVLTAHLHRHDAGISLAWLEQGLVARWPFEALICPLRLGAGHLQRIRSPFDQEGLCRVRVCVRRVHERSYRVVSRRFLHDIGKD